MRRYTLVYVRTATSPEPARKLFVDPMVRPEHADDPQMRTIGILNKVRERCADVLTVKVNRGPLFVHLGDGKWRQAAKVA